jgi:UDP-3-O-[3-hydroxymyristoyl] N-acetylglucosamine deacetylase
MSIVQQHTIKNAIHCRGVGLHSGAKASLTLRPAAPDSGIVFQRTDAAGGGATIAASWRNTVDSALCTTLTNGEGLSVGTVEHLMAAFAGAGLDNLLVEVDGPEVPIMDGSAAPFLFLIECAGIVEQDAARRAIKVLEPMQVGDKNRSAALLPDDGFSMSFEIDFTSKAVSRQDMSLAIDAESFKSELARARTFGFLHDIDRMRAAGLARGGSLDNAVVVSGDAILNEGGLRYADEFVRHKLLDALGDLYLAGCPIIGHFRGTRSGHNLNRALLHRLFAKPDAWCYTKLSDSPALEEQVWRQPMRARA